MKDFLTLQSTKFGRIIETQASLTQVDEPLIFLARTAVVPADDNEIRGRFEGKVYAADIVADDATSAVYSAGKFTFSEAGIVNLKIGARLNQSLLNQFLGLRLNMPGVDTKLFGDSTQRVAASLLRGVRQRANSMICGLFLDSYSYNRGGIKIEGSFGTPANLKVTVATPWTDEADATPIDDIQTMVELAADEYGEQYDTLILPRQDLALIFRTQEYQSLFKGLNRFLDPDAVINPRDPQVQGALSTILGGSIRNVILSDANFKVQNGDGTDSSSRVHPLGKVILTSAAYFNNADAFDWANGIVTESVVAQLTGYDVGLPANARGPVGYIVPENIHLDPPALVAFATQRGFCRKHNPTMNAVLTVRA